MFKNIIKRLKETLSRPKESNFDTRRQEQREKLLERNFGDTKHPASLFDSFPQPDGKVEHMVKQEIIDSAIKNIGKQHKPNANANLNKLDDVKEASWKDKLQEGKTEQSTNENDYIPPLK